MQKMINVELYSKHNNVYFLIQFQDIFKIPS